MAAAPGAGTALARSVAAALLASGQVRVALVPVAGSPGSSRDRDADHVRELALTAARALRRQGVDAVVVPALTGVRRRRDQVGLGRAQRSANLHGSMAATPTIGRLRGRPVVLVDDVVTSGASLAEAARALGAGGVQPVAGAVVAATRLRLDGVP